MKRFFVFASMLLCSYHLNAQTLFTYGKRAVDKDEFQRAFNKNNTGDHSEKALRDYLDLFIAFKLKVQAARDMKLDTLPGQKNDLLNFRRQIENDYLSEDSAVSALSKEAFVRSQQDIRVSHIFIPFNENYALNPSAYATPNPPDDTTKAFQQAQSAIAALKKGSSFIDVALQYSLDPSVRTNKGDIGFITVFSLPYDLETIAFGLKKNEFSLPYKSSVGYHILQVTDQRPGFGRMKAAQILLAYTPGITTGEKQVLKKRADSLYQAIAKGAALETLAKQFSSERNAVTTGGQIPDFGVGRFDPIFENAVIALKEDGAITAPFETSYGVHIVKRLAHIAPVSDSSQAIILFKNSVLQDARNQLSNEQQEKKIIEQTAYKKVFADDDLLWQVTDSLLANSNYTLPKKLSQETVLFSFTKENKKLKDWWEYIQTIRNNYRPGTPFPYTLLMEKFVGNAAKMYYRDHLEDYKPAFRTQLNEFAEGNQLFEVMEKQVWTKAGEDQKALRKFYDDNKAKYIWGPSVSAVFFTVLDKATGDDIKANANDYVKKWRTLAETSSGKIIADSARFETAQLPGFKEDIQPGQLTELTSDSADGSITMLYVLGKHTEPAQKSFEEAKGLVINDYQSILEQKWIATLKKKYPVKVNNAVFNTMLQ